MPVPGPWQLQQNTGVTCGHCQLLHSWAAFIPQVGIAFSKPRKNHFSRTSSCSRLPFWRCWGGIVLEGKGRDAPVAGSAAACPVASQGGGTSLPWGQVWLRGCPTLAACPRRRHPAPRPVLLIPRVLLRGTPWKCGIIPQEPVPISWWQCLFSRSVVLLPCTGHQTRVPHVWQGFCLLLVITCQFISWIPSLLCLHSSSLAELSFTQAEPKYKVLVWVSKA